MPTTAGGDGLLGASLKRAYTALAVALMSLRFGGVAHAQTLEDEYPDASPNDLLPQRRWGPHSDQFYTDFGFFDGGEKIQTALGTFLFGLASLIWSISTMAMGVMLYVTGGVRSNDLAPDALANRLVGKLSNSTPTLVLLFVAGLALMVWRIVSNKPDKTPQRFVASILLMTFLVGVVSQSGDAHRYNDNTGIDGSYPLAAGSILNTLGEYRDVAADQLAQGFLSVETGAAPVSDAGSCPSVAHRLEQDFIKRGPGDAVDRSIALQANNLWRSSYLTLWSAAQFGVGESGVRSNCVLFEIWRGSSPDEISALWEAEVGRPATDNDDWLDIFFEDNSKKGKEEAALLMAVCQYDSSLDQFSIHPDWVHYGQDWDGSGDARITAHGSDTDECWKTWHDGQPEDHDFDLDNGDINKFTKHPSSRNAATYLRARNGHQAEGKIVQGALAIILAFIMTTITVAFAFSIIVSDYIAALAVFMWMIIASIALLGTEQSVKRLKTWSKQTLTMIMFAGTAKVGLAIWTVLIGISIRVSLELQDAALDATGRNDVAYLAVGGIGFQLIMLVMMLSVIFATFWVGKKAMKSGTAGGALAGGLMPLGGLKAAAGGLGSASEAIQGRETQKGGIFKRAYKGLERANRLSDQNTSLGRAWRGSDAQKRLAALRDPSAGVGKKPSRSERVDSTKAKKRGWRAARKLSPAERQLASDSLVGSEQERAHAEKESKRARSTHEKASKRQRQWDALSPSTQRLKMAEGYASDEDESTRKSLLGDRDSKKNRVDELNASAATERAKRREQLAQLDERIAGAPSDEERQALRIQKAALTSSHAADQTSEQQGIESAKAEYRAAQSALTEHDETADERQAHRAEELVRTPTEDERTALGDRAKKHDRRLEDAVNEASNQYTAAEVRAEQATATLVAYKTQPARALALDTEVRELHAEIEVLDDRLETVAEHEVGELRTEVAERSQRLRAAQNSLAHLGGSEEVHWGLPADRLRLATGERTAFRVVEERLPEVAEYQTEREEQ